MAVKSFAKHMAHQRSALAQQEANVRRSALIGVVRAAKASSAKRWCAHFFAWGAIVIEALLANAHIIPWAPFREGLAGFSKDFLAKRAQPQAEER
jgi:hypothetical protein